MAKLTIDDFKTKYAEKITDKDLLLEILEDATDSISDVESEDLESKDAEIENLRTENENLKTENDNLKQRYIDRFMNATDDEKPKEDVDGLTEKEYIDIKEI